MCCGVPASRTDGRTLATLRCAAECLIATFDGISHWPTLEHARDLLMTAAETGKRKDVAAATDPVAVVRPVEVARLNRISQHKELSAAARRLGCLPPELERVGHA
jgi:hypothetical protein